MNIRRKYRCFVCCLLVSGICLLGFAVWHLLCSRIPDQMTVSGYGEIPELFAEPVAWWISGAVAGEKSDCKTTGVKTYHGSHSEEKPEETGWKKTEPEMHHGSHSEEKSENTDWKKNDAKTAKKAEAGNDRTQAEQGKQIVKNGKIGATVIEAAAGEAASDGYAERKNAGDGSYGNVYEIEYTLFGKIPLKTVQACVAAPKKVYAGGTPIGLYLRTSGVLVVGIDAIHAKNGELCCPAGAVLQAGDYIKSADGKSLATKEELIDCFGKSGGKSVRLQVERDGERMTCSVSPVLDESGTYRAGVWVRNDTQGIGTLTYVDDEGQFGALGHGISDIDTGTILAIDGGTLYDADVVSVVRGQEGVPGELAGVIHYSEGYKIGVIEENNPNGIYGTISGFSLLADKMDQYEVAYRQSVTTGPAQILCTIGKRCESYDVELKEVRRTGGNVNKGIVLEVTDEELLAKTGGIVQGMSGSPIIQNGKLIGAVTHVFVNDPKRGYGIFIEDML